jgi:hypothetical protein
MMDLIYNYRHWLSLTAIALSFIGTLVIIGQPTVKYFRGYIWNNPEIKQEIEDEARGIAFARPSSGREKDLADSIARGFITTYKSTFWGFLFILVAFALQTVAVFF